MRILVLTPGAVERDPRALRQLEAARTAGYDVAGLSGPATPATEPARRDEHGLLRELRGLVRLALLTRTTASFVRRGRGAWDVVHANDLGTLPAAFLIARRSNARLVYDAHELYSGAELDPPRFQRRAMLAVERALTRRARVVTVSEAMADELVRVLRLSERPLVVLNCPPAPQVEPDAHTETTAVYQAAAGVGRDPEDLLAATVLPLTLRIQGADVAALRARVHDLGLDNVTVADPLPPDALVDALRAHDVGVIIDRPVTRNNDLAFPNKLFEYMAAGLAVVVPRLAALGDFVEREQIGVVFETGSREDLRRALGELAHDRARVDELRRRAWERARDEYNAETQATTLLRAWTA